MPVCFFLLFDLLDKEGIFFLNFLIFFNNNFLISSRQIKPVSFFSILFSFFQIDNDFSVIERPSAFNNFTIL